METKRKGAKVQCDGWKGLDTREGEGHGLAGLIFLAAKYRSTQGKARQGKAPQKSCIRILPGPAGALDASRLDSDRVGKLPIRSSPSAIPSRAPRA